MGCHNCLTPDRIVKFHKLAKESGSEVSVCLVDNCGARNANRGDMTSVDRAGNHPECTCVVHIHPEENVPGKVYFSCMPSSRDISIVILDALNLLAEGYSIGEVAQYEDAVFYKCGYIVYSVTDMHKLSEWMSTEGIKGIEKIDSALQEVFDDIKIRCLEMHGATGASDLIDKDSFLRDVKARWIMFCSKIGIGMREVIL